MKGTNHVEVTGVGLLQQTLLLILAWPLSVLVLYGKYEEVTHLEHQRRHP